MCKNLQSDPNYQQKDVESDEHNKNPALSTPKAGYESIVSKIKGILDIRDKLMIQMETCDSLREFEKKIMRNPN